MINFFDTLAEQWAHYYDSVALIVVCLLAIRLRSVVAFLILLDFTLVYFGQNWLRSLSLWGSLGLDYHYVLGIKDALIAATLLVLAANPLLTLAYVLASLSCWSVWSSYSLLEYGQFLDVYHAWSPVYAFMMVLQIIGLSTGDGNAGKIIRRRIIPLDWDRIFQPVNRVVYARIAFTDFKITGIDR